MKYKVNSTKTLLVTVNVLLLSYNTLHYITEYLQMDSSCYSSVYKYRREFMYKILVNSLVNYEDFTQISIYMNKDKIKPWRSF